MSQLDNSIYIDLIVMFWLCTYFIGITYIMLFDILFNWSNILKYFWLNFIVDLKLITLGYLATQTFFENKVLKHKVLVAK